MNAEIIGKFSLVYIHSCGLPVHIKYMCSFSHGLVVLNVLLSIMAPSCDHFTNARAYVNVIGPSSLFPFISIIVYFLTLLFFILGELLVTEAIVSVYVCVCLSSKEIVFYWR